MIIIEEMISDDGLWYKDISSIITKGSYVEQESKYTHRYMMILIEKEEVMAVFRKSLSYFLTFCWMSPFIRWS